MLSNSQPSPAAPSLRFSHSHLPVLAEPGTQKPGMSSMVEPRNCCLGKDSAKALEVLGLPRVKEKRGWEHPEPPTPSAAEMGWDLSPPHSATGIPPSGAGRSAWNNEQLLPFPARRKSFPVTSGCNLILWKRAGKELHRQEPPASPSPPPPPQHRVTHLHPQQMGCSNEDSRN